MSFSPNDANILPVKGEFEEEINYRKTNRASAVIKFSEREKQIQLL
jgi:hypothetical protein